MNVDQFNRLLTKLDAVLAMLQDTYELLAKEALHVEDDDANSNAL